VWYLQLYYRLKKCYEEEEPEPINLARALTGGVESAETSEAVRQIEEINEEVTPQGGSSAGSSVMVVVAPPSPHPALEGGVPSSSVENPMIIDGTPEPPSHRANPPAILVEKSTVKKVLEIMKGIVDRSESRLAYFELKSVRDQKSFKTAHMAELKRHEEVMNRLLSGRLLEAKAQARMHSEARREISALNAQMEQLIKDLDLNFRDFRS
jgi:hypothetical protein